MKLKKVKKILFPAGAFCLAAFFLAIFLLPIFSVRAADYVPLAPIPGTVCPPPAGATAAEVAACATVSSGGTNLNVYLTGIFKVGIAAAGVLAFLMIVWGGFTYLSTDAITGKEEGKARVQRALGGLVLALAAYIILNTINPQLVKLNLNFGGQTHPKDALTAPPDFISTNNEQDVIDLAAENAVTRGKISKDLNSRIQVLDAAAQTRALTPAEEQEWEALNNVRNGTVVINRINAGKVNIMEGLNNYVGLTSHMDRDAQAAIERLRSEVATRIAEMAAEGATVGQMRVVRRTFDRTIEQINHCIDYHSGKSGSNEAECGIVR